MTERERARPEVGTSDPAGVKLQPVTPRTVSDQVAEQLRNLITSGEYKPGDRIPAERDLALSSASAARRCAKR